MHADATKARERLGWEPRWSLREGLEATIAWYRAELEILTRAGELRWLECSYATTASAPASLVVVARRASRSDLRPIRTS
jgi:hypothetical protein